MIDPDLTRRYMCDGCGEAVSAREAQLGWPLDMGDKLLCPSCYGDEAFCRCGEVLPASGDEGNTCVKCLRRIDEKAGAR